MPISVRAISILCFAVTAVTVAAGQTESGYPVGSAFGHVQFYSFGYSLAPAVPGTSGNASLLSTAPFTVAGLECPYCTIQPLASRTHFVLQPIAQTIVYHPHRRLEIFHTQAIVQPLLPDYIGAQGVLSQSGFRIMESTRIVGSETGMAFSPDRNRRVWLGGSLRFLQQLNTTGGKNWRTMGGSISFRPRQ